MSFELEFGCWPQVFFLVLARVAGIMVAIPFFYASTTPAVIKVAGSVMLAAILTPLAPPSWAAAATGMNSLFALLMGILGEVLLGAAVGLVCNMFLAAFLVGGEIVSYNAGLMMAQEIDPQSGVRHPALSHLMQSVFILAVVLSGSHLLILKLIARSFFHAGPQLAWANVGVMEGLIELGSAMYEWALRLAAPAMCGLLIVNAGFGLIAKMAPAFDILFMSIPVRLATAILVFGVSLMYGQDLINGMVGRMLEACAQILAPGAT